MEEKEKARTPETPETPDAAAPETEPARPDRSQLNAFENFYENFRKVPLKYIDIFIGVCITALVVVILVGILKSKGFF